MGVALLMPACFVTIEDVQPGDGDAASAPSGGSGQGDGDVRGDGDGDASGGAGGAGNTPPTGGAENSDGGTSAGGTGTGGSGAGGDGGSPAADCGNNQIDDGEDCDEGGVDTATCDADCSYVECGDNRINVAAGEACDSAKATQTCWQCDDPTPTCPNGCTCEFNVEFERYYAYCHGAGFQFAAVRTNCQSTGYQPISIESARENEVTAERAAAHLIDVFYTGGSDAAKEGEFVWPTGQLFSIGNNPQNGLHVQWSGGEPNGSTAENCVQVTTVGATWTDISCSEYRDSICEFAPPR